MAGWLPEGYQEDQMAERAGRAMVAVRKKVVRRRRIVRSCQWTGAAVAVAVLAFALSPKLNRQESTPTEPERIASKAPEPAPIPQPPAPDRQATPQPPIPAPQPPAPNPQSPTQIDLAKSGTGVRLAWEGDADAQYVIYRCTSPRFDTCTVAGEVRGTQWVDREANTAPLVFYKVEPRT